MNREIYEILTKNDKLEGDREAPSSFTYQDYLALEENADKIGKFVEETFSEVAIEHHYAQDASYAVRSIVYKSSDVNERCPFFTLLYSKFGNMVTVVPFSDQKLDELQMSSLVKKLKALGFVPIPPEILSEKYKGRYDLPSSFTWWDRFFNEI